MQSKFWFIWEMQSLWGCSSHSTGVVLDVLVWSLTAGLLGAMQDTFAAQEVSSRGACRWGG